MIAEILKTNAVGRTELSRREIRKHLS